MKSLANHFLVAMPNMDDPFFKHAVAYVCEHNDEGAMGLVVNHPIDVTVGELLDQIDIDNDKASEAAHKNVFAGGPVHTDRGFVLHTPKYGYTSSQELSSEIMITTSKDVLASLTYNSSPDSFIITLGYSGWVSGQLEKELKENVWLVVEADPEIIFNTPSHLRWEKAIEILGIDLAQLSNFSGNA